MHLPDPILGAAIVGTGASFVVNIASMVAQSDLVGSETESLLQYGATGILGVSFLAIIYALSQGKLTTTDMSTLVERAAEREAAAAARETALAQIARDAHRREDALFAMLGRGR